MNVATAAILGAIQGLTEFLPVSSSGHLVLAQSLIPGFSQPGALFDVILHAGTLLAVVIFFWKKILKLNQKSLLVLAAGSIPAGLVGLAFESKITLLFSNVLLVGLALLVTAAMNYLVDKAKVDKEKISLRDSLVIGVAQAIAITPGISRSGATIFAATTRKIKRQQAAEFSFLLSIPSVGGAVGLEVIKHGFSDSLPMATYLAGFVCAFVFGIVSIKMLLDLLVKRDLKIFAAYCAIVGSIALVVGIK